MPETPDGMRSHLDYWLYGIVKVTSVLGNTRSFLRSVQEETIEKLLDTQRLDMKHDMDPIEILRKYNRQLDRRGILDADDVAYHRKGGPIAVTVGESCPYRTTCNWLDEDRIPLPCFRAIAMGELLRLVTKHSYDARLARFGTPCHLTFKRRPLEEASNGD